MKKISFLAKAAVAACVLVSSAAHADRWNLVFHDLHHVYTDLSNGGEETDYGYVSLDGYFLADDFNHDGQINFSEVSMVSLGGNNFIKSAGEIATFSYTGGNAVSFNAYGYRVTLSTSGGLVYGSGGYIDDFGVDAKSFITVTAAPVPEASSFTLFLAGLLSIGSLSAMRRLRGR